MTTSPAPISASVLLGRNAIAAGLYAVLGLIALGLGQLSGLAAPVWPAAGLAFAMAYLWSWRVLPGIALGSFTVNAISLGWADVTVTIMVTTAVAIAIGAALEALAGSAMVHRAVGPRLYFGTPREILLTLLLAGPVACLVNPTVGVVAQYVNGVISLNQASVGWLTWWVGDSIGVVAFAPLCLMLFPSEQDIWSGRRWKVVLPTLLIILGLSLAFVQNSALERQRVALEVDQLASEAASDLRNNIARHQEVLESVGGLIRSSDFVSVEEFRDFTSSPLARYPNLQALSWNPRIKAYDLAAFEETQRAQPGLEDFTVTERDAAGELRPVSPREDYVVVGYIEPLESNRAALGFDIQSNPARQQAIARARDTGLPSATAPIDLVQDESTQKGMLALLPVYGRDGDPGTPEARQAELRGFAVGIYRLGDLLAETYAGENWDRVDIRLIDVTDPEPVEIADLTAREPATIDAVSKATTVTSLPLDVYGRSWELQVSPTSGPLAEPTPATTPSLLLGGLLVVFLLQAFVLLLTGLERQARREAQDSSYEANHDPLTGLLNRRAFLRQFAGVVAREREGPSTDVLLFCDLDGFKLVNDHGGHEAGDRILVAVAAAMRKGVRGRDIVARMGGDEFAMILVDCPPERGLTIADAILESVEAAQVQGNGLDLSVGISIGAAVIDPTEAVSIDELLRRADAACYEAKRGGKGHVRMYESLTILPDPGPRA